MFNLKSLLNSPLGYHDYIWQEVTLLKQTSKAILVMFNDQKEWLPKAWIIRIKPTNHLKVVKIKISEYHWAKKFA